VSPCCSPSSASFPSLAVCPLAVVNPSPCCRPAVPLPCFAVVGRRRSMRVSPFVYSDGARHIAPSSASPRIGRHSCHAGVRPPSYQRVSSQLWPLICAR
jgi:hypothetical protein